jgi:hypothetical protein
MSVTSRLTRLLAPVTAAAAALLLIGSVPASASSQDVVRTGACSGGGHWKLKVGPDDGRLEVEGEVDTNRAGQTWTWSIRHDGRISASGTSRTAAPSGSFEVRRIMPNLAGADSFVFYAKRTGTTQTCLGRLNI